MSARIIDGKGFAAGLRERVAAEVKRVVAACGRKPGLAVVLVGDEPYYGRSGFKAAGKGRISMPGPVDPARLLIAELEPGAFDGVSGAIRPDWPAA